MGFFDNYDDSSEGGGLYVSSEEKQGLIDDGTPFPVIGIKYDPEGKYGARYVATILLEDEEEEEQERYLAFQEGTVDSRDRMLEAMKEFLEDDEAKPPVCKLVKVGRSVLLKDANAPDEEEKPAAKKKTTRKSTRGRAK